MKLFAIYIGGEMQGANIEVHDMRFVIAENIEATYPELKRQWWGVPQSLHLDCWTEITQADGYKISLKAEPYKGVERLYYVNLGGYIKGEFTEVHKNTFVVAETPGKAKARALKQVPHWNASHKDYMYEAEQCFCINKAAKNIELYIHLEKIDDESPPPFTCKYKPIGKLKSESV